MDILKKRNKPAFGVVEAIALALYAVLIAWFGWHHDPWADEAQAWLIARDSSLGEVFFKQLHYEGTPGLWHLLLWILSHLHLPYSAMHVASAVVGITTAWFILRFSPFPAVIRLALPFTFFLVFPTAIVARNYNLVPLLGFLLCKLLSGRKDHPVAFALIAGLLANTALLSVLMSFGFVALYIWRRLLWRDRSLPQAKAPAPIPLRGRLIPAGMLLFLLWGAAFYAAFPAPDASTQPIPRIASHQPFGLILSKFTGIPLPQHPLHSSTPIFVEPQPIHDNRIFQFEHDTIKGKFVNLIINVPSILFFLVSSFSLISAVFYVFLVLWLYRKRTLPTLIPLGLIVLAAPYLSFAEHHAVVPMTALVASLWITWAICDEPVGKGWVDRVFAGLLLVVLVEQVSWTGSALNRSMREHFDGGPETAQFLATHIPPQSIAGFSLYSVTVKPYFKDSVFFNHPTSYWSNRLTDDPDWELPRIVAERPQYILVGESTSGDARWPNQILPRIPLGYSSSIGIPEYLASHAYHETHRFCGKQPAHFGYAEQVCQLIFEPISSTSAKAQ
jgi:hypothetical protein